MGLWGPSLEPQRGGLIWDWDRGSGPSRGTSRVPLPSFLYGMGRTLNTGSEAGTEVKVVTCLSSMVARDSEQILCQ